MSPYGPVAIWPCSPMVGEGFKAGGRETVLRAGRLYFVCEGGAGGWVLAYACSPLAPAPAPAGFGGLTLNPSGTSRFGGSHLVFLWHQQVLGVSP